MKNVIVVFALLISYKVSAGNPYEIANAKIGETFALEEDQIFDEGVTSLSLYENKTFEKTRDGRTINVNYFCKLYRNEVKNSTEIESSQCPDYPRTKVTANKFRVIRNNYYNYEPAAIYLAAIEKRKNINCQFRLVFECTAHADGHYFGNIDLDTNVKKRIQSELENLAAKFISVKPDTTKPTPWP